MENIITKKRNTIDIVLCSKREGNFNSIGFYNTEHSRENSKPHRESQTTTR